MRLRDYQKIIRSVLDRMSYSTSERTLPTTERYVVEGLKGIRVAIEDIKATGLFLKEIEDLQATLLYQTFGDKVVTSQREVSTFASSIRDLSHAAENLLVAIDQVLENEPVDSISIKLPDINDFGNLQEYSGDLNKIFKLALENDVIQGKAEVKSFDTGSLWVGIIVGGALAYGVVAAISWSAALVFKELQKGNLLFEQVKGLEIKNEAMTEIKEKQQKLLDVLVETEASNIHAKYYKNDKNKAERLNSLRTSIKLLSNLIEKGARVEPSNTASEDAVNLFPDFTKLPILGPNTKLLSKVSKSTEKLVP
jgi:hypothetical protein